MKLDECARALRLAMVTIAAFAVGMPFREGIGAQEASRTLEASIAPGVIRPNGGDFSPMLRFDVAGLLRRHVVRPAYPYSLYARGETRGAVAMDPDENPEQLRVVGAAGVAIDLTALAVTASDPSAVDAPGSATRFDYGTVSLGAQLDVRSDQRAREVLGAVQAELLYTHDHQHSLWPFVPAVAVGFGVRQPLRSELRDEVDIARANDAHLDASAAWHLSLDRAWLPVAAEPFWLHGELRYFGAFGAEDAVEAIGADEGTYVAASLAYRLRRQRLGVAEMFVRWSDGELQTRAGDRRAWMLGIVIGEP